MFKRICIFILFGVFYSNMYSVQNAYNNALPHDKLVNELLYVHKDIKREQLLHRKHNYFLVALLLMTPILTVVLYNKAITKDFLNYFLSLWGAQALDEEGTHRLVKIIQPNPNVEKSSSLEKSVSLYNIEQKIEHDKRVAQKEIEQLRAEIKKCVKQNQLLSDKINKIEGRGEIFLEPQTSTSQTPVSIILNNPKGTYTICIFLIMCALSMWLYKNPGQLFKNVGEFVYTGTKEAVKMVGGEYATTNELATVSVEVREISRQWLNQENEMRQRIQELFQIIESVRANIAENYQTMEKSVGQLNKDRDEEKIAREKFLREFSEFKNIVTQLQSSTTAQDKLLSAQDKLLSEFIEGHNQKIDLLTKRITSVENNISNNNISKTLVENNVSLRNISNNNISKTSNKIFKKLNPSKSDSRKID